MLGLKIETVSDILGHAEISTTQRYAHIVDELRDSEMDHWDKLSKDEFLKNDSKEQVIYPSCDSLVMASEKEAVKLKKFPVECSKMWK